MISPYPNVSAFRFGNWFWNGSYKKSKEEGDKLIIDMMLAPDFDVEDLRGVNFNEIDTELARNATFVPWENGEGKVAELLVLTEESVMCLESEMVVVRPGPDDPPQHVYRTSSSIPTTT
jgi:hypothetical protein